MLAPALNSFRFPAFPKYYLRSQGARKPTNQWFIKNWRESSKIDLKIPASKDSPNSRSTPTKSLRSLPYEIQVCKDSRTAPSISFLIFAASLAWSSLSTTRGQLDQAAGSVSTSWPIPTKSQSGWPFPKHRKIKVLSEVMLGKRL